MAPDDDDDDVDDVINIYVNTHTHQRKEYINTIIYNNAVREWNVW